MRPQRHVFQSLPCVLASASTAARRPLVSSALSVGPAGGRRVGATQLAPGFVERGGAAVYGRRRRPMPRARRARARPSGSLAVQPPKQREIGHGAQRQRIVLHALVILERISFVRGIEQLPQPRDPLEPRVGVLEHQRRRVARRVDVVVRRGDEAARRVQLARQVAAGIPATRRRPCRAPAGVRSSLFRVPVRRQRRRAPRDVAVDVAADQVLGRRLPVHRRVEELAAVPRLREAQAGEVRRRARLAQRRPQRVGATPGAVLMEDRTVTAELQLDGLRRPALDLDLVADDAQRLPGAVPPHLVRVRRIDLLDVDVLLVGADDRQAPGDAIVVPERRRRRTAARRRRSRSSPGACRWTM